MRKALGQWEVAIAFCLFFNWTFGDLTKVTCSGWVWVEPAPIFEMGLNVSIICQSTLRHCQPRGFHLYKTSKHVQDRLHMKKINQTTAQLRLSNFQEPRAQVFCTVACARQDGETLICGKDIASGYPPAVPANLTCFISEHSGHMTCTWDAGKPTYMDTQYSVHVKSLQTGEEQLYLTSKSLHISTNTLRSGKLYSVWVRASNALGAEESDHLRVNLDDIVIPALPVITRAEDLSTSVPTTIIHWQHLTLMAGVFCEMRHKAATSPSWKVKELEINLTSTPYTELEPNTKYEFQARCRQRGRGYGQEWSVPFFHNTPAAAPQVDLKSFQDEPRHVVLINASIFKDPLISGNRNPSAGLLTGMVLGVTVLSALFLTVIFKQSLRVRIKRRLLLFLPTWLHEDVPNVRINCALKTLQEINEFIMNHPGEPFLDPDPIITEVEETFLHKERPPAHSQVESTAELVAIGDRLESSPLEDLTVSYLPAPSTGYKPQISHLSPLENPPCETSEPGISALEFRGDSLGLGKNVVIRNCPSPVFPSSSPSAGRDFLSLEKIGLVLDHSESGPVEGPEEADVEALMLLEKQPSRESLLEQTLLPDALASCLRVTGGEEAPEVRSYFPQRFGRPFP
ncbi:interleukin-23 receptor [Gracilinanus agilis]|uniref:interleukin-23 receptor n=1 Tax=Gracilinanus agilis TaxID=191870 RepID=UPI001CFC70F9|nr:interleukin-23 receptor [Gracilinanus agilis]